MPDNLIKAGEPKKALQAISDRLTQASQIASLLISPLIQGALVGLCSSFALEVQKSFIGQVLLPTLFRGSVKLTAALLPAILVPYASWIMVGIPAAFFLKPFLFELPGLLFDLWSSQKEHQQKEKEEEKESLAHALVRWVLKHQQGEKGYPAYILISWILPIGVSFFTSWTIAGGLAAFTSSWWLVVCPLLSPVFLRQPQQALQPSTDASGDPSTKHQKGTAPEGQQATSTPQTGTPQETFTPAYRNEQNRQGKDPLKNPKRPVRMLASSPILSDPLPPIVVGSRRVGNR